MHARSARPDIKAADARNFSLRLNAATHGFLACAFSRDSLIEKASGFHYMLYRQYGVDMKSASHFHDSARSLWAARGPVRRCRHDARELRYGQQQQTWCRQSHQHRFLDAIKNVVFHEV